MAGSVPSDAVLDATGTGASELDMVVFPESGGNALVDTAPGAEPVTKTPLPPPTFSGGMKGPCATCCDTGLSGAGMVCGAEVAIDDWVEPVTSPNAALPSVVQPESVAAPKAIPTNATNLSA